LGQVLFIVITITLCNSNTYVNNFIAKTKQG